MSNAMTIVAFKAEHAVSMLRDGIMEKGVKLNGPNAEVDTLARQYEDLGTSMTIMNDGEPIACAIIRPLWPGVIELTALLSVRFAEHKVSACRACKQIIEGLFRKRHLHRIETTVRSDFRPGLEFVRWLGFRREGVARQHSHDRVDAIYYAIVR